jgi:hypothetical protein
MKMPDYIKHPLIKWTGVPLMFILMTINMIGGGPRLGDWFIGITITFFWALETYLCSKISKTLESVRATVYQDHFEPCTHSNIEIGDKNWGKCGYCKHRGQLHFSTIQSPCFECSRRIQEQPDKEQT